MLQGFLRDLTEVSVEVRKIDFKRFSKKYNPALRNYDFSLDALLK